MAVDYLYKSTILKTDLCKKVNRIDKQRYINIVESGLYDSKLDEKEFDLVLTHGIKAVKEARKINKALYSRYKRLRNRVKKMLINGKCVFATFNFSPSVLESTNELTRRKYIQRHLKSFNCQFVANIDFGSDKEYIDRKGNKRTGTSREHYHALIGIERLPMSWQYGFEYLESVDIKEDTDKKLSKYIAKLSNHAIKESTKRSALIYSR